MTDSCVVCHTAAGRVCHTCQQTIDGRLTDLPARLTAVARHALEPSRSPAGERVAMGAHVHSSPPTRVAALSLLGPGCEVSDPDQIGLPPPREWLDIKVRRWRAHFGHHVPARTMLGELRPYMPATWRLLLRFEHGPEAIAMLSAAHAASGAAARLAYRGLLTPHPGQPEAPLLPRSVRWDVEYLRTWLGKACAEDALDIAGFAAELHALHAEIGWVLNDTPELTWLGRCPAFVDERDHDGQPTGRKRPCGGELWQENGAFISAQVRCPRCHITWDTRGHAGAGTAREIRRVWPIDRRRRYTADDIDRLRVPACRGCGRRVTIDWRDVTGTRDKQRTWQPVSVACPAGCDEARRLL